jgi:hypothetical protein
MKLSGSVVGSLIILQPNRENKLDTFFNSHPLKKLGRNTKKKQRVKQIFQFGQKGFSEDVFTNWELRLQASINTHVRFVLQVILYVKI